ncbi:MAG: tubulin-like doman-containing protein [Halobacteriaceae archaeon]
MALQFTPTVVIGVGESGARMVSRIDDIVESEGGAGSLMPLVIDTKSDEMESYASEVGERNQHVLRHPVEDLTEPLPERPYLSDGEEIPGEGGAQKSRSLGRFYLDSEENLDRTYHFLRRRFETFVNRQRDAVQNFDVWIVNSYGGGTGSGVFPLLSGMVYEVCANEIEPAVRIRGVGTLPKLAADEVDGTTPAEAPRVPIGGEDLTLEGKPAGDNRHRLNTYGALRELKMLLDDDHDGVVSFDLAADSDVFQFGEFGLQGSPFDEYFLVAFDESKNGRRTYQREINTIVGRLVYYIATVESAEDYPEGVALSELTDLCTIDAARLQFPTETVAEYLTSHQRQRQIDDLVTAIERQQDQFEGDLEYLNSLLALPQGRVPDEDSPVERSTVRLVREESRVGVEDFPMEHFDEENVRDAAADTANVVVNERQTSLRALFSLDDLRFQADELSHVADVDGGADVVEQPATSFEGAKRRLDVDGDEDRDGETDDADGEEPSRWDLLDGLDATAVVEYLYYDQFATRIRNDLTEAEQDLERTVAELWDEYADEFREQFPTEFERYQGAEASRQAEGLEQFLYEERNRRQSDDGGLLSFDFGFGDSSEDLKEDRQRLKEARRRVSTVQKRQTVVEELRNEAGRELQQSRNRVEDADDALEAWTDRLESRREQARNQARDKSERMQSWYAERFAEMEVGDVSNLTPSILNRLRTNEETVDHLIGDGILSRDRVVDNIDSLVSGLDEPLEDLDVADADSTSILSVMYSDENSQGEWFDEFERIARDHNIDQASEKRVDIRDGTTFFFLAVYTNIDIRNMSEYSLFHEAATEQSVSELLVGDYREELERHLEKSIAYPELLEGEPAPATE